MTDSNPPPEAQRFGRSQTPESPRPVHIPEPSTIPVLLNQMDPVFNDTATYNIPHNQTFSPSSDSTRALHEPTLDDQDAVEKFLRGAEEENARLANADHADVANPHGPNEASIESKLIAALANDSAHPPAAEAQAQAQAQASASATVAALATSASQPGADPSSATEANSPDSNTTTNGNGNGISAFPLRAANAAEQAVLDVQATQAPREGTVDYQSLLDTISQSAATAPAADPVPAPTTGESHVDHDPSLLSPIPGLPPKPPAQLSYAENAADTVVSNPTGDLQAPYQVPVVTGNANAELTAAALTSLTATGLVTQPLASWAPFPGQTAPADAPLAAIQPPDPSQSAEPTERPWSPQTQSLYDQFLDDERRYVTDGIWDKFPHGSRLFVGNLPSEKVTKRDIFHIFHKHGRLAQISIKQAYGFVQFLEASSCHAALQAEQGVEIRGRKVHLEVSKPQKNTRSQNQANKRRRSRSPERGNARHNDRFARSNMADVRNDRRRDDYRGRRSPSPRGYRSRDDHFADAHSPRFAADARPLSPYSGGFQPTPSAGYDEDSSLPLPRRDPREVPDVQLLVLEPSVAQSFINWIEQGFRAKGLRASTIWLSARLPLNALVKRQIIEGVQAVVKLTQGAQYNSKIPLQVFDRSTGASNVNFNEYVDLDVAVAADIVAHARLKERRTAAPPPPPYMTQPVYSPVQYGAHQPPSPYAPQFPPNMPPQPGGQFSYPQQPQYHHQPPAPATPSANAPNLQQLLANLRQPGDGPNGGGPAERPSTDLAGLLNNVARQHNQGGPYPPAHVPPHAQPPVYGPGYGPGYGTGQPPPQQNMQHLMDTLARYKPGP